MELKTFGTNPKNMPNKPLCVRKSTNEVKRVYVYIPILAFRKSRVKNVS